MGSETLSFEITGDAASGVRAFKDTAGAAGLASAAAKELNERLATQSKTAQVSAAATLSLVKADQTLADAELTLAGRADETSFALKEQGKNAQDAAAKTKEASDANKEGAGWLGVLASSALLVAPGIAAAAVAMGAFGALAIPTLKEAAAGTGPLASGIKDLKGEYADLAKSVQPQVIADGTQAIAAATRILPEFTGVAHAGGIAVGDLVSQLGSFATGPGTRQFLGVVQQQAVPATQALGQAVTGLASGIEGIVGALAPLAKDILPVVGDLGSFIGDVSRSNPVLVQVGTSATAIALAFGKLKDLSLVSQFAGWAGGLSKLESVTKATTTATKALAVADAALDAVSPVGWATLAAAAIATLTYAAYKSQAGTAGVVEAQQAYIASLEKQYNVTGYNISGYRELAAQQTETSQLYLREAAAAKQAGDMQQYYLDITAAGVSAGNSSVIASTAKNLAANLDVLQQKYGITATQAEELATAAGVTAKQMQAGGSAAQGDISKIEQYASANSAALQPTTQLATDVLTLDNNMLSATVQLNAFNDAFAVLVGTSVSDQAAILADAQAFASYQQAVKQSGAGSLTAKQAFLSYIQSIGTSLSTLIQNKDSVADINSAYLTNIKQLQSLHDLTPQQRADVAGLVKDYDLWASSTVGLSKDTVDAANKIASNLVTQLKVTHSWTPQVSSDITTLSSSILKTGANSEITKTDRQRLITDLENAGLSAQKATSYVNSLTTSIEKIPKSATTQVRVQAAAAGTVSATWAIDTARAHAELHFARGGQVPGHASSPGDNMIAAVRSGEFIVSEPSVRKYGTGMMKAINAGSYATGGLVGLSSYETSAGRQLGDWASQVGTDWGNATVAAFKTAAGNASALTGPLSASAAVAQAFARSLLPSWGWASQWTPLDSLWTRESGWNPYAVNPQSGAYGIPQALPASWGHPYNLGDYKAQDQWGLAYISGRYGSPSAAWQHELSFGWYDNGGLLKPGLTLAMNNTGRPEQVLPPRASSGTGNVTVVIENHGVIGSQAETDRWLNDGIDRLARQGKLTYALRRSPSAG